MPFPFIDEFEFFTIELWLIELALLSVWPHPAKPTAAKANVAVKNSVFIFSPFILKLLSPR